MCVLVFGLCVVHVYVSVSSKSLYVYDFIAECYRDFVSFIHIRLMAMPASADTKAHVIPATNSISYSYDGILLTQDCERSRRFGANL